MSNLEVILNVIVVAGMIISAILASALKKELGSVIALGVTGLFAGMEFLLLHAPDVAISEVAVGAALTPLVFVLALRKVNGRYKR